MYVDAHINRTKLVSLGGGPFSNHYQSSIINQQSSIINHQSSVINHQATFISHHGTKSWPRCCKADLGSRIKISLHLWGRSDKFFEPDLFRLLPGDAGWAEMVAVFYLKSVMFVTIGV